MIAVLPAVRTHRIPRQKYEQMVEAGIFGPEDRLELLDGELIEMAPQKSRHATAISLLAAALQTCFDQDHHLRVQMPLALDEYSEPEPDLAVVPGSPRDYRDAHPGRAALVIEVAESTLAYERGRKLAAYARAGIPEYWILDLGSETLEVCRRPMGEAYGERRILAAEEALAPLADNGRTLRVAEILP
ncbi:MAG: Uma2 family endonuclease [Thiobacillaceae bacterium]|nr:Uma2 family endonuclease [Thiobacillaceae bacterium]